MMAELSLHAPTEPETIPKPRVCLKGGGRLTLSMSSSSFPPPLHLLFFSERLWYVCLGGAAAHVCRFACKGQMLTPGLFFYFSSYVQRQGFSIESRVCQFGQGVTLPCFCLLSLLGHTSLVLKWVWGFQVHSSHLCGKPFWLSLLSIPLLLLWMCFIIQLMDQYILLV